MSLYISRETAAVLLLALLGSLAVLFDRKIKRDKIRGESGTDPLANYKPDILEKLSAAFMFLFLGGIVILLLSSFA